MLISPVDFLKMESNLTYPHKGIVVDNLDPLMLGRLKVTVAGIFEEEDPEKLPWVYPVNATGLGGSDSTSSFAVPEIDTELTIIFPYKDVYMPFYSGYWQSATTHQAYFDDDYPESYGFMDSMGNKYKVNKLSGDTEIEHQSGAKFTIDIDGTMTVDIPKDLTLNVVGDTTIDVTGNSTVTVGGDATVTVGGDANMEVTGSVAMMVGGDLVVEASGTAEIEAPTINVGAKATAVNLGKAGNLCNNLPACMFTGAPHSPGNISVKC